MNHHIDYVMAQNLRVETMKTPIKNIYFVTGTDTDVGKTVATIALLKELKKIGLRSLGVKPISAGCNITEFGLRNDDALLLQEASAIEVPYDIVNPIAYPEFIAPHIAAEMRGQGIEVSNLNKSIDNARLYNPDYLLIEGAGGWRLPINSNGDFFSDFVAEIQCNVILVVGMKLGCLNHTVLTYEAIKSDGLNCIGWIANQLSLNMDFYSENLSTLSKLLPCPLIGEIPFQSSANKTINLTEDFLKIFC